MTHTATSRHSTTKQLCIGLEHRHLPQLPASALRVLQLLHLQKHRIASPVGLKLEHASESPGGLFKRHSWAHPRVSDEAGIHISSKFSDDAKVAGSGTTHLELLTWSKLLILHRINWSIKKGRGLPKTTH